MNAFLQQHLAHVTGLISGFDRLRFRGTLRMLANVLGLDRFLRCTGHLLKDFKTHAPFLSRMVRSASLAVAQEQNRPFIPLPSPSICKEDVARERAQRDGVTEGLIAVLAATETCGSYDLRSDPASGRLQLVHSPRRCQHLYHYYLHPVFGFMHVRLQTWLPFNLHVCINGREWLARQMDAAGIAYERADNCFPWISDPQEAQKLLDAQVALNWPDALGALARQVNPALPKVVQDCNIDYYWSLEESEWATDVMFRSPQALQALYPSLIRHGMQSFGSRDVLRFLGQKVPPQGGVYPRLKAEVCSNLKQRPEGLCIKHRVNHNSVKMYDKQGSVLRALREKADGTLAAEATLPVRANLLLGPRPVHPRRRGHLLRNQKAPSPIGGACRKFLLFLQVFPTAPATPKRGCAHPPSTTKYAHPLRPGSTEIRQLAEEILALQPPFRQARFFVVGPRSSTRLSGGLFTRPGAPRAASPSPHPSAPTG